MKKKPGPMSYPDNPAHKRELLEILAAELPPVIARKAVERHLGGLVTTKTMANADAEGKGPKDPYAVGRNIVYRREALLEFIGNNFSVQRLETLI